jgi:hypothetical protein
MWNGEQETPDVFSVHCKRDGTYRNGDMMEDRNLCGRKFRVIIG